MTFEFFLPSNETCNETYNLYLIQSSIVRYEICYYCCLVREKRIHELCLVRRLQKIENFRTCFTKRACMFIFAYIILYNCNCVWFWVYKRLLHYDNGTREYVRKLSCIHKMLFIAAVMIREFQFFNKKQRLDIFT